MFRSRSKHQITFNHLYNKYKWTEKQIEEEVNKGHLTPISPFSSEQTSMNNITCSICYNFYPLINETNCCHQHICTECFAACITPEEKTCPFCRKCNLSVKANQRKENLKIQDFDDLQFSKHEKELREGIQWDELTGFSDEIIAASLQYNIDPSFLHELSSSGISEEEILQIIQMQH